MITLFFPRCVLLQLGQTPREPVQAHPTRQYAQAEHQTPLAEPLHIRAEGG